MKKRTNSSFGFSILGLVIVLTLMFGACSKSSENPQNGDSPHDSDSEAVSQHIEAVHPNLDSVSEAVRYQIQDLQHTLETAIEVGESDVARIASNYGELGKHYHAYGFMEAARACYLKAIEYDKNDMKWHYFVAHVYRDRGENELALQSFEEVLRLTPGYIPALLWQGEIYWALSDLHEASWKFELIANSDQNHAQVFLRLGQIALKQGNQEAAVELLEKAAQLQPQANIIYYSLGIAYRTLGQLDRAEGFFDKRGEIQCRLMDPLMNSLQEIGEGTSAYISRGTKLFKNERYGEAAECFRKALDFEPDHPYALINLGTSLSYGGRNQDAIDVFEHAISTDLDVDTRSKTLFNLGYLYHQNSNTPKAIAYLEDAISVNPSNLKACQLLADMYFANRSFERALPHLDALLSAEPTVVPNQMTAARCLYRLERYRECLLRLETAQRQTANHALISCTLSQFLSICPDASLRDSQRALDIVKDPVERKPSVIGLSTLSIVYASLGDFEAAIQKQEQALNIAVSTGKTALEAGARYNLRRFMIQMQTDNILL